MSATIGALMVDIGANVARLQHDMDRAQRTVQSASNKVKSIARTMGVSIAAGLSVGAIINAGEKSLEMADKYAKAARTVGMSVESLSAFNHVAELSGTSFATVEKSAIRLSANMKDVRDGVGEARGAFEELNISVTDSEGKMRNSESVMMDIADRFAQMEDGGRKTALAVDIFGRSGAQLIPMLDNGSAGIRAMMEEAERLGVVFDSKTAAAAERINDQFLRVRRTADGFINNTVSKLIPDIEKMSNMMFAAASNTAEMDFAARTLSTGMKLIMSGASVTATAFKIMGSVVASVAAAVSFATEKKFNLAWETLKAGASDTVETIIKDWERMQKIWTNNPAAGAEVNKTVIVNHLNNINGINDAANAASKALVATLPKAAEEANKYVSSSFNSMGNSLAQFVTTGKASFKDLANSIISDMARIAIQEQVTSPLTQWMTSALSSWGGTPTSISPQYDGAWAKGGVFGPGGHVTAFAGGGAFTNSIVSKPTLFPFANGTGLMGEAGPEAIMPLTRIGGKLGVRAEGGGSSNVTINQNFDMRDHTSEARLLEAVRTAADEGARRGYELTQKDIRDRGPIAKSMGL